MNFKHVLATGLITATLFGATNAHAQTEHFIDVPTNHWSKDSIDHLTEQKIISGYGNGKFGFGDNVTRGQVAAIISRYLKLENTGSQVNISLIFMDICLKTILKQLLKRTYDRGQ